MSRQARVVAEAVPHHVTQRGNNRQDIFLTDDDRRFYIDLLREKSAQFGVTLLGYCLMTNHVHLVAVPSHANSLAKALGGAQGDSFFSMGLVAEIACEGANKQLIGPSDTVLTTKRSCPLGYRPLGYPLDTLGF
jgi:hypothetical protein